MSASPCASRALALALLLVGVACALPAPAAAQEESSFSHRMAQGRFFLEQGLLQQALAEFEAASLLPEGTTDVAVHQLIARTRYKLGQVGGAVESARTAAALQERLAPEFAEFHEFLTTRFGKVLVVGARAEDAERPEPVSPILDPELKRAFEAAMNRLDGGGSGSTSIYLPVGSYRVAGHIVEVKPTTATRMDLRPSVGVGGTGGVYGERRGGGTRKKRPPRSGPQRRSTPQTIRPGPVDLGGALDVRVGGLGYGQQGNASGGMRAGVGGELVLGHRLAIRGAVQVGGWRAERVQLLTDDPMARGAGPALFVDGSLGVSFLTPIASGVLVGPEFGWHIGGSAPIEAALPAGYLGPTSYLVHGPELGMRTVFGNATMTARPQVALKGFVREHWPSGTLLPSDAAPHLSIGGLIEAGVRVQ